MDNSVWPACMYMDRRDVVNQMFNNNIIQLYVQIDMYCFSNARTTACNLKLAWGGNKYEKKKLIKKSKSVIKEK